MQKIHKQIPPKFLSHYRNQPEVDWDCDVKGHERDEAREQLCREQGSLCCFCESRIRPNLKEMKIAHFIPQTVDPSKMWTWSNLLGACKGGEGKSPKEQHCDTSQRNMKLSRRLDPIQLAPGTIFFTGTGEVHSSDQEADADIKKKLNLNVSKLKTNRKGAAEAMMVQIGRHDWKDTDIDRKLRELASADGTERVEYQSYLMWWLQRRLRRAG